MKKILAVLFAIGLGLSANAQGTIFFGNDPFSTGSIDAPVFDVNGTTKLAGTAFTGQIYAGPNAGSLLAVGATQNFYALGSGGEGYFNPGAVVAIPTVAPGATASVQIRVWSGAATYALALTTPGAKTGTSTILSIVTGGGGSPPSQAAYLTGLTSFSLVTTPVPEPATYALLGLGALGFALRRRK